MVFLVGLSLWTPSCTVMSLRLPFSVCQEHQVMRFLSTAQEIKKTEKLFLLPVSVFKPLSGWSRTQRTVIHNLGQGKQWKHIPCCLITCCTFHSYRHPSLFPWHSDLDCLYYRQSENVCPFVHIDSIWTNSGTLRILTCTSPLLVHGVLLSVALLLVEKYIWTSACWMHFVAIM